VTETRSSLLGTARAGLPRAVGLPLAIGLILLFVAILFPWDSVARRVAWEIGAASGGRVTIDELAPAWTARGPVLRARAVSVEHPAVDRVRLATLEIAPRFSTSWLSGEPRLRVWADSDLARIDGVLQLGPASAFRGDVEGVDLARVPMRLDATGVRLSGLLSAHADVALDPGGTLSGRIEFESPSLVIESDALPIALPFSRSTGIVEILESGATRLDSVRLEGAVVSVSVEGEIGLVHHSQAPPVDLVADLRVEEPSLRRMASGLGLRLDAAGATSVRVQGPLDRPSVTPR